LVAERRSLWNSGLFVWKSSSIVSALERCRPGLARAVRRASPSRTAGPWRISEQAMRLIEAAPIDTAVLEKTDNLFVVRASFEWSDLGNWNALADRLPTDRHGNRSIGRSIAINSSRCVTIGAGGLTTLIGVRDLVVVQKKGVVLVCARAAIGKMRDAQRLLRGALAVYA
jgi:mannose-1-phosphate guanylyltransferase